MRDLLHRLGFTYKKASHVPGKADAETREAIVVEADSINAESAICLLRKIEGYYPLAPCIYVFF